MSEKNARSLDKAFAEIVDGLRKPSDGESERGHNKWLVAVTELESKLERKGRGVTHG